MINFLQTNSNYNYKIKLINNESLNKLYIFNKNNFNKKNKSLFLNYTYYLSFTFNKDIMEIIELYIQFLINEKNLISNDFLNICETILNCTNKDNNLFLNLIYFFY